MTVRIGRSGCSTWKAQMTTKLEYFASLLATHSHGGELNDDG
jgi:hypothetical protein